MRFNEKESGRRSWFWGEEVVFVLSHGIRVECHFLPVFPAPPHNSCTFFSLSSSFFTAYSLFQTQSHSCSTMTHKRVFRVFVFSNFEKIHSSLVIVECDSWRGYTIFFVSMDFPLLWIDIFKSQTKLQASEGYGWSSFSNRCLLHRLSPLWSSSLRCFGVYNLGTAALILLHWLELNLCVRGCFDRGVCCVRTAALVRREAAMSNA